MKYSSGDSLYYVCPFMFTIEKVCLDLGYVGEDGFIYYIDRETGAELAERTLFEDLNDAICDARILLNKFYELKQHTINNYRSLER